MSDRCLIEWHQNQPNWPSQKGCSSLGKLMGPDGVIFGPGFTGVKVLQSRQICYQNFGHQMRYKLYFDHFPPHPARKKLFPKNTFFARMTRATDARVTKTIF